MISLPPGAILLLGAVILPLLPRQTRSTAFLVFPVLAFCWLLYLEPGITMSVPFLHYELVVNNVDQLSLAFGYVFALITFLGGIYGFYIRDTAEQVATLLYAGSSMAVVFAGDLITLIFFWEIMAWSSTYLIWARRTPEARGAGTRYLLVHLFGGSVLLAGILLHINQTGSIIFDYMHGSLSSYLILFGFTLNAAVPPLHAWLSDAYPEGTVTGSVYLSAFTTKAAVYVLARGFAGWDILIWAGAIMTVYGVVFAFLQNDIRRLLAYHIISQVGYMVCAVGIGTHIGINGAVAHAFAHILYKALLFMGAGAVLYTTGRSKLTKLGGLARTMPAIMILYLIGGLSISGVPLFSGFVSKSVVIHAAEISHIGAVVLLLYLASVGTFLSTTLKLPYFTWFGSHRSIEIKAAPKAMYVGMTLTAMVCIAIGIFPRLLYNILPFPMDYQPYTTSHLIQTIQLLTATGIGFWLLLNKLSEENLITLDVDWLYRKPAGRAYTIFVVFVSRFFNLVEEIALRLTRSLVALSANPVRHIFNTNYYAGKYLTGAKSSEGEPQFYSPDRYRVMIGVMVVILILAFIVLVIWSLTVL